MCGGGRILPDSVLFESNLEEWRSDLNQTLNKQESWGREPHILIPTTAIAWYGGIWQTYLCKLLYSEKKVEQVWEDPEFTVLNSFFDIWMFIDNQVWLYNHLPPPGAWAGVIRLSLSKTESIQELRNLASCVDQGGLPLRLWERGSAFSSIYCAFIMCQMLWTQLWAKPPAVSIATVFKYLKGF